MAFVPVSRRRGVGPETVPTIRMYYYFTHQLRVTLNRPLLEKMKWVRGDCYIFNFGVGDDVGTVRLDRVERGGYRLTQNGASNHQALACIVLPKFVGNTPREDIVAHLRLKDPILDFEIDAYGSLIITGKPLAKFRKIGVAA